MILTPRVISAFTCKFLQAEPSKCWPWIGSTTQDGYGEFRIDGRNYYAHRIAYALKHRLKIELNVLHCCDNRICVNADHLFLGTHQQNNADMNAKNRQARGSSIGTSMLREEHILEIRIQAALGISYASLADRFNVSTSTISRVVNYQTWTHV